MIFWSIAGLITAITVSILTRAVINPVSNTISGKKLSFFLTGFIPLAVLGSYLLLGRPELTAWKTKPALPPFISAVVSQLEDSLKQDPKDKDSWLLLGDVYRKIDRYQAAATAYRQALALDQNNPHIKTALAEMLVDEQGGTVGAPALELFHETETEPSARYYLALAQSQSGDWQGALDQWQALLRSSPADAPWRAMTSAEIDKANRVLGLTQKP